MPLVGIHAQDALQQDVWKMGQMSIAVQGTRGYNIVS